jgi:hypothetical protein
VTLPLGYLRTLGVAPAPPPVLAQGPLEELLEDYRRYLFVERDLSAHTVLDAYEPAARLFLAKRDGPDGLGLEGLRAADVTSFLARECPKRSVPGARDLVCALRCERSRNSPGGRSRNSPPGPTLMMGEIGRCVKGFVPPFRC